MVEGRVAWEHALSRRAWSAYRAAGLRWLAVGLVSAVLVVVVTQVVLGRSRALLTEGAPTTGTVRSADEETVTFEYDAGGQSHTATLEVVSGRRYAAGDEVEVRYDRSDPATARLVDEPARLPGVGVVVMLLGLVALGSVPIGIGVLVRARRWGRAMRREPWRMARLRLRGTDVVLLPVDGGEQITGRMLVTTRWRTKTVTGMDGQELWMLPAGPREVVLTADGTDTVYGVRRRT